MPWKLSLCFLCLQKFETLTSVIWMFLEKLSILKTQKSIMRYRKVYILNVYLNNTRKPRFICALKVCFVSKMAGW